MCVSYSFPYQEQDQEQEKLLEEPEVTVATEVMVVTEGVQTAKFCLEDQEDLGKVAPKLWDLREAVVEEAVWVELVAGPSLREGLVSWDWGPRSNRV